MAYIVAADTDVGIAKQVNQDSILVEHARCEDGEIVMALVCDGMGGFAKGEVASATVVRAFSAWFKEEFPKAYPEKSLFALAEDWAQMLKGLNRQILEYSRQQGEKMGTTFSGLLLKGSHYVAVHVGDSRIYTINQQAKQITQDQTFVAREIERGTMSLDEAKQDTRRNMLLQCVGASQSLEPEIYEGNVDNSLFLLCSDGLPHELSLEELQFHLNPALLSDKVQMQRRLRELIELVKIRNERDNISAIAIKMS